MTVSKHPGDYYLLITPAPENRLYRVDTIYPEGVPEGTLIITSLNEKKHAQNLKGLLPFWETSNLEGYTFFPDGVLLDVTFWALPRWGKDVSNA